MKDALLRAWVAASTRRWDLEDRLKSQRGAVALEYLLIIGLVVILLFAILWLFMDPIKNMVNQALKKINNWLVATNSTTPGS